MRTLKASELHGIPDVALKVAVITNVCNYNNNGCYNGLIMQLSGGEHCEGLSENQYGVCKDWSTLSAINCVGGDIKNAFNTAR